MSPSSVVLELGWNHVHLLVKIHLWIFVCQRRPGSCRTCYGAFVSVFGNYTVFSFLGEMLCRSNLFACPPDTPVSPDIIDVVILSLEVPPALNYIQIPVAKKLEVSPSPFAAAFLSSPMSTSSSECGVSFAAAFVVCSFCSNRVIEMQVLLLSHTI